MEPFLLVPPAEHLHMLPFLEKERHILRKASEIFDAEYVFLQTTLDNGVQKHGLWNITVDGIHLTDTGNQLLAEQWIKQFARSV